MTIRTISIGGNKNILQYDDSVHSKAIETDGPIQVGAPVGASDAVRLSDVAGAGAGDVVGPASATDHAVARFDSTTGKLIQEASGVTISDSHVVTATGTPSAANDLVRITDLDDGSILDGDHVDIDFTPTNYSPSTTPPSAADVDDLAAHLAGIDDQLGSAGSGDITGPASVTDNTVARFDGTTGNLLDESLVIIDNLGAITGVAGLAVGAGGITSLGGASGANGVLTVSDVPDGVVVDGDVIDIDFTPTHYGPDASPAEASDVNDLAAHLKGIDNYLGATIIEASGSTNDNLVRWDGGSGDAIQSSVTNLSDTGHMTGVATLTLVDTPTNSDHAVRLTDLDNGAVLDGDHVDIDFTPSNYTPDSSPAEAADVDDLAAHLKGIDDALDGVGSGDVVGPSSAVDDRIATFDGTTGKLLQDAMATITGLGEITCYGVTAGASGFETAGSSDLGNIDLDGDLVFKGANDGIPCGALYANDASITVTIGSANSFYKVTGLTLGLVIHASENSDAFNMTFVGLYKVDYSITFNVGALALIESVVYLNGSEVPSTNARALHTNAFYTTNLSGTGIIDVTNSSHDIDLRLKNVAATDNISVLHVNFVISQLGGT